MLEKKNRLCSNRAFCATYKNNNIVCDNNIILYAGKAKTDPDSHTRVGFVVSKKVHKRAVKRNRIKRLMREAIRHILNKSTNLNNYQSLIFSAKADACDKNYIEIENSINNLIVKLANKNI